MGCLRSPCHPVTCHRVIRQMELLMPDVQETELVVLGGGPGGYAAAFLAADRGLRVTLIDAAPKPGGTCLHVGCIPSKALLHAAHLITAAREAGAFGITFAPPKIDINVLRAKKEKIVDMHASHLLELCKKRNVTFISGRGAFTGPRSVQVEGGPAVEFKHAIIATGSVPARLPALALESPRVLDSTSALQLEDVPATL